MSGKDVASLIHARDWIRNENVGKKMVQQELIRKKHKIMGRTSSSWVWFKLVAFGWWEGV